MSSSVNKLMDGTYHCKAWFTCNNSETWKRRPPLGPKICGLRWQVIFIFRLFNMRYEGVVLTKCGLRRPAVFDSRGLPFQVSLYIHSSINQYKFKSKEFLRYLNIHPSKTEEGLCKIDFFYINPLINKLK